MKGVALVLFAVAQGQVPVDKTSYCCAGINDCEVFTGADGDPCPNGEPGPMPEWQCMECMKLAKEEGPKCGAGCDVVLTTCNSSDPLQKWSSETFTSGASSDVKNVGSSSCLEAIQVDPIQTASCLPTPGSAGFAFANGTLKVSAGMMHVGMCVDAHGDVGLRDCDTSPAQQYVYDKTTGSLSQNGKCLAIDYK